MNRKQPEVSRPACPSAEVHTPCPDGYIQWHRWADEMEAKGWHSTQCAGCGRYAVWVKASGQRAQSAPEKGREHD